MKLPIPDRAHLLTIAEACQALGIGRTKTYELVMSGALASVKIGSRRLIAVSTIAEYIEHCLHTEVPPTRCRARSSRTWSGPENSDPSPSTTRSSSPSTPSTPIARGTRGGSFMSRSANGRSSIYQDARLLARPGHRRREGGRQP